MEIILNLILIILMVIMALFMIGLLFLFMYFRNKHIQDKYDKEQAAYMAEHPDSYGIGELRW